MTDWEVDAIIGAGHEGVIISAVDKKSKSTCLQAVATKTKARAGSAFVSMLGPASELVLAVTADNGKEFAGHRGFGTVHGANI